MKRQKLSDWIKKKARSNYILSTKARFKDINRLKGKRKEKDIPCKK